MYIKLLLKLLILYLDISKGKFKRKIVFYLKNPNINKTNIVSTIYLYIINTDIISIIINKRISQFNSFINVDNTRCNINNNSIKTCSKLTKELYFDRSIEFYEVVIEYTRMSDSTYLDIMFSHISDDNYNLESNVKNYPYVYSCKKLLQNSDFNFIILNKQ